MFGGYLGLFIGHYGFYVLVQNRIKQFQVGVLKCVVNVKLLRVH